MSHVVISPDSARVVAAFRPGPYERVRVIILSRCTGDELGSFDIPRFCSIAYSSCGRYLLAGHEYGDIVLWDALQPARRALLALLGDKAWHKFLCYIDGDHAVVSRMLAFY